MNRTQSTAGAATKFFQTVRKNFFRTNKSMQGISSISLKLIQSHETTQRT